MKDNFIGSVGIWGQRHYQYLKKNKPSVIRAMRLNGTLKSYLQSVNDEAEEIPELQIYQKPLIRSSLFLGFKP